MKRHRQQLDQIGMFIEKRKTATDGKNDSAWSINWIKLNLEEHGLGQRICTLLSNVVFWTQEEYWQRLRNGHIIGWFQWARFEWYMLSNSFESKRLTMRRVRIHSYVTFLWINRREWVREASIIKSRCSCSLLCICIKHACLNNE